MVHVVGENHIGENARVVMNPRHGFRDRRVLDSVVATSHEEVGVLTLKPDEWMPA